MPRLTRRVVGLVLGSFAVYVGVAACAVAANQALAPASRDAGADVDVVIDDAPPTFVDSFLEELGVDAGGPVKDASADAAPPPPPFVASDVPCIAQPPQSSGAVYWFAEKTFPGRSRDDLARATVMVCHATAPANAPSGYTCQQSLGWVRDGAISVFCGAGTGGPSDVRQTVRISMPPVGL